LKKGEEEVKDETDRLLEKLIEFNFSTKLTCMCYESNDATLSIGFTDGKIECFKIEIEQI
jgi:hypothetical protein